MAAWQTPPGARPNRGGAPGRKIRQGCFAPTARVGCLSAAATQRLEEWLPAQERSAEATWGIPTALQNPAYRPPGKFLQCIALFRKTVAIRGECRNHPGSGGFCACDPLEQVMREIAAYLIFFAIALAAIALIVRHRRAERRRRRGASFTYMLSEKPQGSGVSEGS